MSALDALVLDEGEAKGARVVGGRHAGESFERARLVDVELVRCDLSGCNFSEATWHRVRVVDCRCTGIELAQTTMRAVVFDDCKLDDANLRLAQLRDVGFTNTVLVAAELIGARLEQVKFPACDLRGADFSNVRCAQVDLRDARLDGLKGVGSLGGATIGVDQLVGLAPALAHAAGIVIGEEIGPETGGPPRARLAAVLFVSLRDLQFRRRRFIIGIFAAGLVFALALVITGISQSFHNEVWRTLDAINADQWVVSQKASGPFTATTLIPAADARTVSAQAGVTKASPILLLRFTVAKPNLRDVGLIGVEPGGVGAPTVVDGRVLRRSGEVVVDKALNVGIGKSLKIGGAPYHVVGRTDGITYFAGQPAVFMTLPDAQKLGVASQPLATAIVVRGHVARPPAGTFVETNTQVFSDLRRPMKAAGGTIDMMRILLWIVAAGIIGSILYIQAIERTRDFAVFKATGVTGRSLAWGLAVQAIVIALFATVVAIVLSVLLAPLMPIRVELPTSAFVLMPAVAIVISIIASLFGLRRAVQVDPALAFG